MEVLEEVIGGVEDEVGGAKEDGVGFWCCCRWGCGWWEIEAFGVGWVGIDIFVPVGEGPEFLWSVESHCSIDVGEGRGDLV